MTSIASSSTKTSSCRQSECRSDEAEHENQETVRDLIPLIPEAIITGNRGYRKRKLFKCRALHLSMIVFLKNDLNCQMLQNSLQISYLIIGYIGNTCVDPLRLNRFILAEYAYDGFYIRAAVIPACELGDCHGCIIRQIEDLTDPALNFS